MIRVPVIAATALAISLSALSLGAPAMANDAGQWMDIRNRIAMGAMPNGSEPVARLLYAKAVCRAKTGQAAGEPLTPAGRACLKAEGFVWLPDTPAEIAARERARSDAEWRAAGAMLGQAAGQVGQAASDAMSPRRCSGMTQPGGYFNMRCY